ncbi:MAG: cysteine desulfurase [Gemmatimonadetes bacterium]|uniref:Cysteine desulfurase n=1 Tax=Candidatus Kutchimonas denitrificans TaxID=3056748 RepID=A0AAE4Z733_9BACT|nr:cysteine desulfurase [Gemmatimonadota bacterium]NIR74975.1 cysteine desulfurase [Candidatus Kutchimonas denitrificans]NIS01558.1 cysteine desulfurase [Gemmatimonadota bacterium]NIT67296.1 cysteine desulfurase [Gemmatimonadota bacterium]NIU52659.1 aminotransferase class V-fold PLP-dependent enzyme [Gemmatimonadota bacterium]
MMSSAVPGPVYLDYSATTPLRPEVREAMRPYLEDRFGNPSSIHGHGRDARSAVEDSRRQLISIFGAENARLVFTGSGSEADNLAVLGFARAHPDGCVVRSSIEHKAVVAATKALAAGGYDVREAPVDARGVLDLDALAARLPTDPRPTLVSVMWANNETGVVQPIEGIAALCAERGAVIHSDAVQAFGKLPLAPRKLGVSLVAVSAHKLAGPKGVGALLIDGEVELEPLVYGGGQESGLRSGTHDVAGIVGLVAAARIAAEEQEREARRLAGLRDRLESTLVSAVPDLVVNGGDAPERLPNVLNVSLPGVDIEGLLTSLDLEGIRVSSGSACTTGSVEPSHVMRAMGREGDLARNTIRMSLGWGTNESDIEYVLERFPKIVERVRAFA